MKIDSTFKSFKKFFSIILFLFFINNINAQKIIVSQAANSKYKTVQSAIDAIPCNNNKSAIIYIKKGIYKEIITIDTRKNFITLIGEDASNTILTYNNHAGTKMENGDTLNTWTCASSFIYGNNITTKNITFQNTAGFTAGQAVALRVEGNRCAFYNCKFIGNQDVLFLSGNGVKNYFKNCYVEGTTDFIFGAATAVFDSCTIHSKKNSHVTASSTNSVIPFGFVFFNCKLTADTSIHKVSLGRPWSPTASVTYINCTMGSHIIPEGWNNWKNPANELTARFAEYNSVGEGANANARLKWTKQLTKEEIKKYTLQNILGTWRPE